MRHLKAFGDRSSTLDFVLVSKESTARSLRVLPRIMFSGPTVHRPDARPRSIHRWWSPDFRRRLYTDLGRLLEPPDVHETGPLSAEGVLRVAGVGLVSSSREEIGFGIDLLSALEECEPEVVRLVIDGADGLRYLDAFESAARRSNHIPFRLLVAVAFGESSRIRFLRLPRRCTSSALRLVSRWRSMRRRLKFRKSGRARHKEAQTVHQSCDVAIFDTTSKGWETSRPILMEFRRRNEPVLELSPKFGANFSSRSDEHTPVAVESHLLDDLSYRQILRSAIDLIPDEPGSIIERPGQRRVAAEVIARRAAAYVPGIAVSMELARLAVQELGAKVTLQEDHSSPSGRAFLIEASRLGAHTVAAHHGMFDPNAPEREYFASPGTILEWGDHRATFPSLTRSRVVGNHLVEERMRTVLEHRDRAVEDPIVLVAFGRPGRIVDPEFFASAIRVVARAAAESSVPFIVNLHPGDTSAFWDTVLAKEDRTQLEFSRSRVYDLMERAIAVVTNHSTVGAEAMLADIPVICITTHRDLQTGVIREASDVLGYVAEGAAYPVASAEKLRDLVEVFRNGGADPLSGGRMSYARRFLDRSGSRSSHLRTVDVILDLANEKSA